MYQSGTSRYIKSKGRQKDFRTPRWILGAILLLLCLMAMDMKNRVFYFAIAAFFLTVYIRSTDYHIHQAVIPAIILSVSCLLFSSSLQSNVTELIRPIIYPLCILTGYNFVNYDSVRKTEKRIFWVLAALAIGTYGHFLLNMLFNLGKDTGRNTFDYWTRVKFSATGQSALATLMIGFSIAILFSDYKIIYKMICAGLLLSIHAYNLVLGGRTIISISAILLFINFVAKWSKNRRAQDRIRGLLILLGIVIIIIIILNINLFGIKDAFFESNFYQRFLGESSVEGINEDARMEHKLVYFKLLLAYPFGGNELFKAAGNVYAHDIILDTYSQYSIFATISIIIMLIDTIIKCKKMLLNKWIDQNVKSLLLNVIFAIMVVFMMEPILQGMPWLFASYCVIYGTLTKMIDIGSLSPEKGNPNSLAKL